MSLFGKLFKDPLTTALLIGGTAATAGALAPALAGGAGGLAGIGGAEATAGLLGSGAASGAGSQAAMIAAQNAGFGPIGEQLLAGSVGAQPSALVNGLAGIQKFGEGASAFGGGAKPYMQAASTAKDALGLLADDPVQPVRPGQTPQADTQGPQLLSQIYQQGVQMTPEDQERLKRKTQWG